MPDATPYSTFDADRARQLMVDGQLRPNKVTDRRILDAMRTLPREIFVPAGQAALAYIDDAVKLGHGRVLTKPLVLARLIQLARPHSGETALIVGSATGYAAAVLALCGLQVFALEQAPALIAMARSAWPRVQAMDLAGTVTFIEGKLAEGHAAQAPYDLVFIDGAVPEIPPIIARQVAATGRLATVISKQGSSGVAVLAEPSVGGLRAQAAFDANTPLLPELTPTPSFSF